MKKRLIVFVLTICLLAGSVGCSVFTKGDGSWEIYAGVRTKQHSVEPASIGIEFDVVEESIEKIVDSLTDGEVSPDE